MCLEGGVHRVGGEGAVEAEVALTCGGSSVSFCVLLNNCGSSGELWEPYLLS